MTGNEELLRAEMDRQGITDNELRAGLAAIVGGESGFHPRSEESYVHTSAARIRGIFRTAFAGMTDERINELKADDVAFFNYVYGPSGSGPGLGNVDPDDGFNYRGRGGIQLTGRANYQKLSELSGLDLIGNPDLVNDPQNSVVIVIAYMRWRYHGGGWEAMKAAVGNSFGTVDAQKNALFAQYQRTGEFDYRGPVPAPDDRVERKTRMSVMQAALQTLKLYDGQIDGLWGPMSRAAFEAFRREAA